MQVTGAGQDDTEDGVERADGLAFPYARNYVPIGVVAHLDALVHGSSADEVGSSVLQREDLGAVQRLDVDTDVHVGRAELVESAAYGMLSMEGAQRPAAAGPRGAAA